MCESRNRSPTLIDEEPMDNMPDSGSPQNARDWFCEEYHDQDKKSHVPRTSFSSFELPTANTYATEVVNKPSGQPLIGLLASSPPRQDTLWKVSGCEGPGRYYCRVDGCRRNYESFTFKWDRTQHEILHYQRIACPNPSCHRLLQREASVEIHRQYCRSERAR